LTTPARRVIRIVESVAIVIRHRAKVAVSLVTTERAAIKSRLRRLDGDHLAGVRIDDDAVPPGIVVDVEVAVLGDKHVALIGGMGNRVRGVGHRRGERTGRYEPDGESRKGEDRAKHDGQTLRSVTAAARRFPGEPLRQQISSHLMVPT